MDNTIRSFSQFLSDLIFLSENLDMLECRDHRQLLVLQTKPVGRKGIGECLSLDAHFFLNHGPVSTKQWESLELTLDLQDARVSWNLAVVFQQGRGVADHSLNYSLIINMDSEKESKSIKIWEFLHFRRTHERTVRNGKKQMRGMVLGHEVRIISAFWLEY